jgi:hypothetical protein
VSVEAPTIELALTEALQALLELALPERAAVARTSRSIAIRAAAASAAEVAAGLVDALMDEIEDAGGAIAEVRIDGLLRGESGLVAWGYATLGASPASSSRLRLLEPPVVRETLGRVRVQMVVGVEEG